jgi:prolyl oligopeptidase
LGLVIVMAGNARGAEPDDPYRWLEEVTGAEPLAWVRARNAESTGELAGSDAFHALQSRILGALDSDAKIPFVQKIGPLYYNFWKDAKHQRGIWRRTTLEEYRKPEPEWETVLDLDALNAAEHENWVWHGAEVLKPDYQRCLISLSRGGADADVVREFELPARAFVTGGYTLPEAK